MLNKKASFKDNISPEEREILAKVADKVSNRKFDKELKRVVKKYKKRLKKLKKDPAVLDGAADELLKEHGVFRLLKVRFPEGYGFYYNDKDPEDSKFLIMSEKRSISLDGLKDKLKDFQMKYYAYEEIRKELLNTGRKRGLFFVGWSLKEE